MVERLFFFTMSRDEDHRAVLRVASVSRETLDRLDVYVALLGKWRKTINLISEASFAQIWTRHIVDCAQLSAFAPEAKVWVDMGSGAGLPGLIIAIQLAGIAGSRVHLIESDQRKSAFLREAARETGAPAIVHNLRIEDAPARINDIVDAVTARALAPLPQLLDFASLWLDRGAIGVFPRGERDKIIERSAFKNYSIEFPRSRTHHMSAIAIVRKRAALLADSRDPAPGAAER